MGKHHLIADVTAAVFKSRLDQMKMDIRHGKYFDGCEITLKRNMRFPNRFRIKMRINHIIHDKPMGAYKSPCTLPELSFVIFESHGH